MSIFILIILAYLLINLWNIRWFWKKFRNRKTARKVVCLLLLLLTICFPLSWRMEGTSFFALFPLWLGAVWTGLFFYLFLLTALFDIMGWVCRKLGKEGSAGKFFSGPATAVLALIVICVIGMGSIYMAKNPIVREVEIKLDPSLYNSESADRQEYTFAVLSDVHLGRLVYPTYYESLMKKVREYSPDALLFPGDILDDHAGLDIASMKRSIELAAPLWGAWACPGNHEYHSGNVDDSIRYIEESGIKILRDQWTVLDGKFLLVGRDDLVRNRMGMSKRKELSEILESAPSEARKLPIILLDHQPSHLEIAEEAGISLQLSGHTHNGQIWPYNLIVKSIFENAYGYSRRGDTHYFVSLGAGTWGPPLRNTGRPEIIIVRIKLQEHD